MSDSSFGNQTGGSKESLSSDTQLNERWEFDRDYLEWDDERDDLTPRSEAILCLHGIRDHFIDSNLDGNPDVVCPECMDRFEHLKKYLLAATPPSNVAAVLKEEK